MAAYEPLIAHVFHIDPLRQYELSAHQWLRLKDYLDKMSEKKR